MLRPRTLLYATLWSGIGVLLAAALVLRSQVDLNVTPVRNPLFVTLTDGAVRNAYELRLRNKQHEAIRYELGIEAPGPLDLSVEGEPARAITVPPDQTLMRRVYLTAQPGSPLAGTGSSPVTLTARDPDSAARARIDTVFHGKDAQ